MRSNKDVNMTHTGKHSPQYDPSPAVIRTLQLFEGVQKCLVLVFGFFCSISVLSLVSVK